MNQARITTLLLLVLLIFVSGTGFQLLPDSAHAQLDSSSASIADPAAAAAPTAFRKISPANGLPVPVNGVVLRWEASGAGVTYQYCMKTRTKCPGNSWKSVGSATSVPITGLTINTTYYWEVRAVSSTGTTYADGPESFWSFSTTMTAPGVFSKTSPENQTTGTDQSLNLTWKASAGSDIHYEYCIFIPTPNENSCGTWVTTTATTAAISGLNYETTYSWQVRAVNTAGITYADGAASAVWNFKTRIAPPTNFLKLTPTTNSTGQSLTPVLTWSPSTGTDLHYEYCIYGPLLNGNACNTWVTTTATTAAIDGLNYETTYSWQVRAVNTAGTTYANGTANNYSTFTTLIAKPYLFNKLGPVSDSMKQTLTTVLEWSASTGTGIQFEYCYQPAVIGNVCLSWTPVNANSVTPPSLAYGTTYIWQVRATNSAGTTYANGSESEVWSFTTLDKEPSVFDKITPVDGAIDRSINPYLYWWAPLDGNTTYDYCISTTNACPGNVWTTIGRNAAIHPTGALTLTPNLTYYWQVRATKVGFAPVEADGAWWSFKTMQAAPISKNQSFTTLENKSINGALTLENTTTIHYFTLVGGQPSGTLVLHSDGTFTYTPPANYYGQVGFQFILTDGLNAPTGPYTATINITPVNDPVIYLPILFHQ